MMTSDAYLLFPGDAPKGQQQSAAGSSAPTVTTPKSDKVDAASILFPTESGAQKPAVDAAGGKGKDFPDQPEKFGDGRAQNFFSGFANSATADGQIERARALNSAGSALIDDARAAGTDAAELASALDIVKERQGDTIAEITPEKMEQDFAASMSVLQSEFGERLGGDLAAARAFIADLEKIAPGTIDSLERTGAGNDPRLIRKAISEARRRGYRG